MITTYLQRIITLVVCSMALASTACARSTQAASSPAKGSTVKAARSAQPKTAHVPAHLAKRTDAELATLGDQLLDKNLLDSALLCFEVVNAREADGDRVLYAHTLHHAGLIYYRQGIYGKAMERYMSSLQICEEDNLERELSTLYKNIGNVYSMFHDFDQSSALYKKSLALARKFKDYALENMALNNLIFAYTDKTPLSQYRRWQQEMLVHPEKRVRYDYDVFMTEAQVLIYERQPRKAIAVLRKAVDYCLKHHLQPISLASSYGTMSAIFLQLGQRDSALVYELRNQQIAKETGNTALLITTLRSLSDIYEPVDKNLALTYKQQYLMLSDSVYNLNEFNSIRNALYFHEMNTKSKAIDKLSIENLTQSHTITSQRNALVLLIIFLVVFLVMFVVIARQKHLLSKSYQVLFDKSQEDIITKNAYVQSIQSMKAKIQELQQQAEGEKKDAPVVEQEEKVPEGEVVPTHDALPKDDEIEKTTSRLPEKLRNELLNTILQVMETTEAYCDSDFGIEKLATMVGSNSRYVSQVINDVYKENFRTFLNSYRVKKAMTRMNDEKGYGHYTIRAIAESVGYKSQANFINVFTKMTGIKPSTYQKMSAERRNAPKRISDDESEEYKAKHHQA